MSKHLQVEIEKLKKKILALSAVVEEAVQRAVSSIERRDDRLAQRIIDSDIEVDHMEVDVEEECLKILALHHPVATDLRFVVSVLKINNDLERIGDLAVNIAERGVILAQQEKWDRSFNLLVMAEKAKGMLHQSLDALVNMDLRLARGVCSADSEVDALNQQMYEQIKAAIRQQPERLDYLIHLLSVSRFLERMADHATNIGEDVIYMIEGEIVRHRSEKQRPSSTLLS